MNGTILTGRTVTWSSSNTAVATVSGSGSTATVTGKANGTATITATSEGKSGTSTITVNIPPAGANNAQAVSNGFPSPMAQAQFFAVSVIMKNTGTATWTSSAGYSLKRVSPTGPDWIPLTVAFGSGSTTPTNIKTFNFNLYTEAAVGQSYNVFYQMQQNSVKFGETNGKTIQVTSGSGGQFAYAPEEMERTYPGGAVGSDLGGGAQAAGDTLQTLTVDEYPLTWERVGDQDVAYIRYFGSLAEAWDADVTFRIVYDPTAIDLGLVRKGLAVSGYAVDLARVGKGELLVRLRRNAIDARLPAADGLLLEIPLVALPGQALPRTLPLVELTVSQ